LQDCADRDGAEPIQRREPEIGERAEVLRERGAWFYAVVAGRRRQVPEGRCGGSGGEGAERDVYQEAIAWLLHRSPVMLPIPGTSSVAHLEENVAAGKLQLTPAEMKALDSA
jgi:hypothetical protein